MWIYLIGVIATMIVMLLGHYILKEDVYFNNLCFIIFASIFSWVGFIAIIILLLVMSMICLSEEFRNKPIIKWKSREKDT